MLQRAERRIRSEPDDVAERIRLVKATGEQAPDVLRGELFGGVLCRGVIMYLDDPEPLVDALCRLAAPGSWVSIVAKNAEVMALRHAHDGDWAAALTAFDSVARSTAWASTPRGDRVEDLSTRLAAHGVEPVAWYGVRLFTDGVTPDRPADDPEELVLEVELRASMRDPYRQMSRLFHILGQRPSLLSGS
jgi:S-adenosylmethionine-dependent methyltransferase